MVGPQRSIIMPPIGSIMAGDEYDTDPHRLGAAYLLRRCSKDGQVTLYYWRAECWGWDGRRYIKISDKELRAEISAEIKNDFNRIAARTGERPRRVVAGLVNNVLQAVASLVLVPEKEELPLWIGDPQGAKPFLSMANGLVDTDALLTEKSGVLYPHTPRWFTRASFPYDYQPDAKCPVWERFLEEVLEGDKDRIALLQEWFGYCLTPNTTQCKFMVLEGEGANGKSVVCEVLTAMLGRENVSNVPLEIFGERFQLTPTLGKLANIASEIGDVRKVAEGQLKQFTSGDRMYFDRKGIPGIEAYPTARLLFSTNQRPKFVDRSNGLWRRMLLLPFRITIPEERQDKMLIEKLRQELPGIFLWAIEGLRRLQANGRFTEPAVCKEALDEYISDSNPCRQFLQDHYELNPAATTETQVVYQQYVGWAQERNAPVLDDTQFGKEVKRVFPEVVRKKGKGSREVRPYVYAGLVAKPFIISDQGPPIGWPLSVPVQLLSPCEGAVTRVETS
jgi:P4 family phage/plasmid primase-like protien